ncbi:MAG: hypothetical protein Q7T80_08885 [Methanoregula sp.]|nr:hypothetical protein [Methanoregula sp.]
MKNIRVSLVFILIIALCLGAAPVSAILPGGGFEVLFQCPDAITSSSCNANDATVYVNGVSKGSIVNGLLAIPYEERFSTFRITKSGYDLKSGTIPEPAPGQTIDILIDATLTLSPTGSGKGWITVHSNIDESSVAFNGVTKGSIASGVFTLEVSTTGTPYTTYSVSKSGYVTYDGSISSMPASDQTIDLYATLNPVPTATTAQPTSIPTTMLTPIGGDAGWYMVSCNVNGATVYFDSVNKGTIADGTLSVQVYSTGTPYKTYRVEKTGYVTASGSLPAAPAKGQTVPVRITLTPISTLTTTMPTTAPFNPPGSEHGWIAIHANVDGATVMVGSKSVGVIRNGVLTIPVATTGTPYSAFTISKTGYTPTTGTVPRQPASGETVDLYVTLNPVQPVPEPTTQSPVSLPVIAFGLVGGVLLLTTRRK